MKLIYYCIYLYLLLKPFYIFKSGHLQPSDVFLLIGFVLLLLVMKKDKSKFLETIKNNKFFLYFLIFSFFINFIYFIKYDNFKFIMSSLYIIFNFLGIILLSFCFDDNKFVLNISKIFKFNLLLQFFIYFAHLGRYFDTYRYMGTFNDPNQFSYYVLITLTFIYLINDSIKNNKKEILVTLISTFLILKSASTGMLMGLLILFGVRIYRYGEAKKIIKFISVFIITISFIGFLVSGNYLKAFLQEHNDNFLIRRINDKFNRVNTSKNGPTLIQERGYDIIIKNPKYILFGAGEGLYERFNGYANIEIHATFPSLLFYYGIIPFIILVKWIYYKIKNNKLIDILLLLPLFIESFTLLNQRQVIFWIVILYYSYFNRRYLLNNDNLNEIISYKKENKKQNNNYTPISKNC